MNLGRSLEASAPQSFWQLHVHLLITSVHQALVPKESKTAFLASHIQSCLHQGVSRTKIEGKSVHLHKLLTGELQL